MLHMLPLLLMPESELLGSHDSELLGSLNMCSKALQI